MRGHVIRVDREGHEDCFHCKVFGRNKSNADEPQRHIDFDEARYGFWREAFWK